MAERWTTGFGFRRGLKILLFLYTYNYKAYSSTFGSCHASKGGYSDLSSDGYTGLTWRHLWEPRWFRLCSDLATRWLAEDSRRYTVLCSLKPPSLLVKFHRDSFPRVKRSRREAYHSPSSSAKIKNSSSIPLLPAHFHDVQSDFTFSYSFHVDIYFIVQPEPTWSDTQQRNNSIIVIGSSRLYVSSLLHYSPQTVDWKKQNLLWLAEGV